MKINTSREQPGPTVGGRWREVELALEQAAFSGDRYEGHLSDESKLEKLSVSPSAAIPNGVASAHVFPGAVLLVGQGGEIVFQKGVGCRSLVPEITPLRQEMVFDVASLTKPIVATTLIMQLVDRGLLNLNRRVANLIPSFGTHGKERITVRQLLSHSAGFPATLPYYKLVAKADSSDRAGIMTSRGAVEMVYNEICRSKPEQPAGKSAKYSDVGFILLGNIIEVLNGGVQLDRIAIREIFQPLSLHSMGYIDLSKLRRRGLAPVTEIIVPTAECPWRGRLLCGEVHDDNAWAIGGIAGHAGLFSSAADIHGFASEMIRCFHGDGRLINRDVVREFWAIDGEVAGSSWGLGWDTPTAGSSSSGRYLSANSVGHLGFTGCSLWIDPDRELDIVLLSNRIHPSVENQRIKEFRPLIHDLVMKALGYD